MKPSLRQQLERLALRLSELDATLADPAVASDMKRYRELSREHAAATELVGLFRRYEARESDLASATQLLDESAGDADMAALAGDEAQALAGDGADQPLSLAAVPHRAASGVDAARQRGVRDDAAAPDRCDEVVLADDAVAVAHEMDEQIEDLGLHRDQLGATAQLPSVGVKYVIVKEKSHVRAGSQETIKPFSRAGERPGKVLRPRHG